MLSTLISKYPYLRYSSTSGYVSLLYIALKCIVSFFVSDILVRNWVNLRCCSKILNIAEVQLKYMSNTHVKCLGKLCLFCLNVLK